MGYHAHTYFNSVRPWSVAQLRTLMFTALQCVSKGSAQLQTI